jgi:hypothetical protein
MSAKKSLIIKSIVAAVLLGFLLWRLELSELIRVLSSADWILVLAAGLIHFATIVFSANRWKTILANFEIYLGFVTSLRILLIGYFFNLFLPRSFGGDFIRAFYVGKRCNRGMSTTLMTTILDRAGGLTALLMIGLTAVAIQPIQVEGVPLSLVFLAIAGFFLFGLVAVFNSIVHQWVVRILRKFRMQAVEEKLELVFRGLTRLRKDRLALIVVMIYSLAIQFSAIVSMWVAAQGLDIDAPFSVFLVFIPVINLSTTLPLTINGIGVRESVYTLLFSQLGIPIEKAFALSLLNFLVLAMTSVPGGIVYSLYKKEESFQLPDA